MPSENDLLNFAKARAANKGVGARIKHSAKFHSIRSALSGSGSAASKGLGLVAMGVRSAFKLIPIPIIGDLMGTAEKAVEARIRTHYHSKRRGEATTIEDKVKFDLKDLSVEGLDRYRWKLRDAVVVLNTKIGAFEASRKAKAADHMPCHALLELADAIAQADRRLFKLNKQCSEMIEKLTLTQRWCTEQGLKIDTFKNDFSTFFGDQVRAESADIERANRTLAGLGQAHMNYMHQKCSDYCYYKPLAEDNWAKTRENLAAFAREVSAPFEAEAFMSLDGSAFKNANDAPTPELKVVVIRVPASTP